MRSAPRELTHRMIDAGAHVYVAHGDPRLQGIEIYRGSPIFYLGNYIFQTKTALSFYGEEVWQSVMVHLHCNDIAEATIASYYIAFDAACMHLASVEASSASAMLIENLARLY